MRQDRKFVLAMIVVWGLAGLIEPHLPDAGQPLNAVVITQTLTFAFLAFAWCKAHAKANGICLPAAAPFLFGVFPPIGLPYYSFRAFGFLGSIKLIALGFLLVLLLFTVYLLCYFGSQQLGT
jgi:hypothetical protein